ncbi:MAG: thioredoxin domain-containing protein [Pseudomonadota bacterium]
MLENESSPYLVQHAANPVHWRPWGQPALDEASNSNKPVLISIGYAACHWCHVMAHESFENQKIADLMNAHFVNIKVDREERPDIDQIYMAALHAMGEQGGWPLTMFTDSDGRPFWGGTYFPPETKFGRAGFPDVLRAISKAWKEDRARIDTNGTALTRHLATQASAPEELTQPNPQQFDRFANAVLNIQDTVNGGTQGAPKFPNAALGEVLARASAGDASSPFAQAFLKQMERMSLGGIYDHVGGGLARYSVDAQWLVPHFEKMLYDNAHYLRHLGWAYKLLPTNLFRRRIEQTIDWLNREMRLDDRAYASSLDADSEGEEGKYYVWTESEIQNILSPDTKDFLTDYDITRHGNFEGNNILNLLHLRDVDQANLVLEKSSGLLETLLDIRQARIPPGRDDKILTDWNGYLIRALADLGFQFRNRTWIKDAVSAFRFISESMAEGFDLAHSYRNGTAVRPGMATDYAAMINAAISLSQATSDQRHLKKVPAWIDKLHTEYSDENGGYFLTSNKSQSLVIRPRCDMDEANPSAASQILEALIRYSAISGDQDQLSKAWDLAANLNSATGKHGQGSAGFINALHSLFNHRHIKIFADTTDAANPFLDAIRSNWNLATSFEITDINKPSNYFGIDIAAPEEYPCTVICTNQSCGLPLTTPDDLAKELRT